MPINNKHTYHIPVMGVCFTVDSPLKVARYGIDSVLSLNGQPLQEKLRKFYSETNGINYVEINEKQEDYRAKRTTAYLNLIDELVKKSFEEYKKSPLQNKAEIEKCINLLPNNEQLKIDFKNLIEEPIDKEKCKNWIEQNLVVGSIDVNIMTKLDRENIEKGEALPVENNDAHAALRGYAESTLASSLILSAGLNPRLFTYMEQFNDFFPQPNGDIKKKIVLKVSDYRSALIQGRFLAKKGLWVSEYRIESGLNCGGHAFATEGFLMGPILEEFRKNKSELLDSVYDVIKGALEEKNCLVDKESLPFKFTAQGGVGSHEEHDFLLNEYQMDSIGWGSPFLLVPEATSVDAPTMEKLIQAKEEDLFLSKISPLGVPFNSLRGTSKEKERDERIAKGKPGSPCIEGNLALFNKEFTDKPVCTASRQYQNLKIKDLKSQNLEPEEYDKQYKEVVDKTCLCTGLVNSVLIMNDIDIIKGNDGVSICPGPNMLYFKQIMSLNEITDHIYGRKSIPFPMYRPNMFIKELYAYIKYLSDLIDDSPAELIKKEHMRLKKFANNLLSGIEYYHELFASRVDLFKDSKKLTINELKASEEKIRDLQTKIEALPIAIPA